MKKRIRFSLLAAFAMLFGGAACTVTPPDVPPIGVPDGYIMATRGDTLVVEGLEWWEIFGDTTLSRLILTALENNRNLAATATTVEAARQNLASVRGSLAPAIDLAAEGSATYTTPATGGKKQVGQSYSLLPRVSWEVALFGIAAANEAAREEWVATEWGYRAARLALEAQVAETYFQWLQYARQLEISEQSYQLRLEAQQKSDSLFYYGYSSGVDLQQARSLTAAAAANIPSYRRAMVQTNLILNTLLGGEPEVLAMPSHSRECVHSVGAQLDGLYCGHLTAAALPVIIPSGLPSELLERRPDVMEAFHKAQASAATVRVARAARLPSISLTGSGGVASATLKGLTSGNPAYWTAALSLGQPLLHFGELRAEEKKAVEEWRGAILNYQQTALQAFADVESALVAIATYEAECERYLGLLQANSRLRTMTEALYYDGLASSLNLIDAERNLYSSQLDYVSLLSAQLQAYVSLYKALGGSW